MRIIRYLVACSILLLASGQTPAPSGGTIAGEVEMDDKGKRIPKPADLWVYLEDQKRSRVRPGTGVVATITQKNRTFDPHVLVIPVGATVEFPNKDREPHNVFSPAQGRNPMWDLGRYGPSKTSTKKFLVHDDFDIYCDIHMEMWAKIKVVPTRHYTKVVDGKFTFASVPPGRYKVVAWAPGSEEVKSDVIDLAVGTTKTPPALHIHWGALNTVHPRMDGTPYGPYGK